MVQSTLGRSPPARISPIWAFLALASMTLSTVAMSQHAFAAEGLAGETTSRSNKTDLFPLAAKAVGAGNYAEAAHLLAQAETPAAYFELSRLYRDGQGVRRDLKKAFDLLTRAATAGYVPAQTDLGVTHALGLGTKADPAKAAYWYGKAADQGEVIARTNLARMKEIGDGIPKDEKGAVELYEKALKDGRAQYYLGKMYQDGRGVKADRLSALTFIRKAADESNISPLRRCW
ncbi:tetratricopeptide repeat protein [Microvirga brassicacearum]|uniref:Sel1 repeat family protein n=1 Tax=Microvirga brassicacearum TaxID=2580413 RepID=A0A5N3P7A1_9HYPH|nr:tetratricopeptide repeat protein [Microvirga brassicacearum]KAB0265541.1 sel1 repeat family protein [Microvirga brassicacearum]